MGTSHGTNGKAAETRCACGGIRFPPSCAAAGLSRQVRGAEPRCGLAVARIRAGNWRSRGQGSQRMSGGGACATECNAATVLGPASSSSSRTQHPQQRGVRVACNAAAVAMDRDGMPHEDLRSNGVTCGRRGLSLAARVYEMVNRHDTQEASAPGGGIGGVSGCRSSTPTAVDGLRAASFERSPVCGPCRLRRASRLGRVRRFGSNMRVSFQIKHTGAFQLDTPCAHAADHLAAAPGGLMGAQL